MILPSECVSHQQLYFEFAVAAGKHCLLSSLSIGCVGLFAVNWQLLPDGIATAVPTTSG